MNLRYIIAKYLTSNRGTAKMISGSTFLYILIFVLIFSSCKKFVDVDDPRTDLIRETVFESEQTVDAAINSVYQKLVSSNGPADGGKYSISFLTALSADEVINYNFIGQEEYKQFNENRLISTNSVLSSLWTNLYDCLYRTNAVIEGVSFSKALSESKRNQATGEAKFLRAFIYFNLVNLFGDVPLVVKTEHVENTSIPKSSSSEIYSQIINDLSEARDFLENGYLAYGNERVRASRGAASAMLARVYLFRKDWANAEAEASKVIDDVSIYSLADLNNVFMKNSSEAIWQLGKLTDIVTDKISFNYLPFRSSAFTTDLSGSFEPSDNRFNVWVASGTDGGVTYHWAKKYTGSSLPPTEYTMILRLAEQYLIRAEARAEQDNISGAQEDINTIRIRAGVSSTIANDKSSLLDAILNERRIELFTEWGHRWFDLKRTHNVDEVIGQLKPTWEPFASLYPIPEIQILNDPAMRDAQNPGYN